MKRTETARASAASAFVSSRSSSGAPPRARRASPPLAAAPARVDRPPTPRYRPWLACRVASSCRAGSSRGRSKSSAPHTCTRGACTSPAHPSSRPSEGRRRVTARAGTEAPASRFMALPAATYPRREWRTRSSRLQSRHEQLTATQRSPIPRSGCPLAAGCVRGPSRCASRRSEADADRIAEGHRTVARPPISTSSRATDNRRASVRPPGALRAKGVRTYSSTSTRRGVSRSRAAHAGGRVADEIVVLIIGFVLTTVLGGLLDDPPTTDMGTPAQDAAVREGNRARRPTSATR